MAREKTIDDKLLLLCSSTDHTTWKRHAEKNGLPLTIWIRQTLNKETAKCASQNKN